MHAQAMGRPEWTLLISGQLTGGVFEMFEEVRDTPGGPPPHVHRERDEAFHVLEGRYTIVSGKDVVELAPGDSIFVPRRTRHGFKTLDARSRTLIIVAPAGLEAFFREMGVRIGSGMSALEAMASLASTYDSHPTD